MECKSNPKRKNTLKQAVLIRTQNNSLTIPDFVKKQKHFSSLKKSKSCFIKQKERKKKYEEWAEMERKLQN